MFPPVCRCYVLKPKVFQLLQLRKFSDGLKYNGLIKRSHWISAGMLTGEGGDGENVSEHESRLT